MKPAHTRRPAAPAIDRRLPLEAIRVFESVVRSGSTVAAAAELGLTHGAVSRRVRALEEHLGAVLFGRGRGGRLTPTELGERFARSAGDALRLLAEAAEAASAGLRQKDIVRISTTASIASLWLGRGCPVSARVTRRSRFGCPRPRRLSSRARHPDSISRCAAAAAAGRARAPSR